MLHVHVHVHEHSNTELTTLARQEIPLNIIIIIIFCTYYAKLELTMYNVNFSKNTRQYTFPIHIIYNIIYWK